MTQVTTIYNNLVTLVTTTLTTHRRLANPYRPEACTAMQQAKGFGIIIGEGLNTNRFISGSATVARAFRIVLTAQNTAKDTDGDGRGALEKTLMENSISLIKACERDPALSQSAMNLKYLGDSGIEFVESATDGAQDFFKTEITLQIEYRESLT